MTAVIVAVIGALAVVVQAWITKANTRQLRPNGGSSVADAVHRMDGRLERMESRQERMDVRQEHMDGRLARLEEFHYKEEHT